MLCTPRSRQPPLEPSLAGGRCDDTLRRQAVDHPRGQAQPGLDDTAPAVQHMLDTGEPPPAGKAN